ncbi:hypothetical protein MLD38_006911 [Melastoma candidum]|uniref:Uncharacterized protein n=1 Tax=Melastoma candidum TaxID=119954 RepID=A0ACB9RP26_9MYRT|nr:hypothetical protein MLD38_006911 [Melastoma candidum]
MNPFFAAKTPKLAFSVFPPAAVAGTRDDLPEHLSAGDKAMGRLISCLRRSRSQGFWTRHCPWRGSMLTAGLRPRLEMVVYDRSFLSGSKKSPDFLPALIGGNSKASF